MLINNCYHSNLNNSQMNENILFSITNEQLVSGWYSAYFLDNNVRQIMKSFFYNLKDFIDIRENQTNEVTLVFLSKFYQQLLLYNIRKPSTYYQGEKSIEKQPTKNLSFFQHPILMADTIRDRNTLRQACICVV